MTVRRFKWRRLWNIWFKTPCCFQFYFRHNLSFKLFPCKALSLIEDPPELWITTASRYEPLRLCGGTGASSVYTEDAPNNPSIVLLTCLKKMLYCTFARGPPQLLCLLYFDMCTGKVKYISRVEFGFYANCWPFFLSLKAINIKSEFVLICLFYMMKTSSTLHSGSWSLACLNNGTPTCHDNRIKSHHFLQPIRKGQTTSQQVMSPALSDQECARSSQS